MYPIMNLQELQGEELTRAERLRDSRFEWRCKKMGSARLARLYEVAGWQDHALRAAGCCTWLQYGANSQGERKLQAGNFCDLRLCPVCTGRRAMKNALKLSQVMNETETRYGYQFLFLTLTVESCEGDKLGAALSQLTAGWNRLMQQRPVLRAVKGWFRAIEITHGRETGYHPHIHAILAVEPGYFKRSSGQYITQAGWVARWQKAAQLSYKPVVHIQKTKGGKGGMGAALEAAKYTTKDSEYIDRDLDEQEGAQIVVDYTKALHKRRLVAFGGCMKEIAAQLGADRDDGDLVHVDDEGVRDDLAELIEDYGWYFGAGDYILTSRRVNPLRVVKADA